MKITIIVPLVVLAAGCADDDPYQPWGAGPFTDPIVHASPSPPPVSGGTLIVLKGGSQAMLSDPEKGIHRAALSDPDRDQVIIVDLALKRIHAVVALLQGDEPGRLAEDADGRLHVSLRNAGAIVTIDPRTGAISERRSVCPLPRGLAYDAASDVVHLACAGGELLTMPAAGGEPTRRLQLSRDLRDVVVDADRLLVSRFRAAELLVVEADGHVSNTLRPPPTSSDEAPYEPAVAWHTVPAPGGGAMMVFQEERTTLMQAPSGGYGTANRFSAR